MNALLLAVVTALSIESTVVQLEQGGTALVGGEPICASSGLTAFYRGRSFAPAWNEANARALQSAILHSADEGLEPLDYHLAALQRERGAPRDLLLTDAFLTLASHLNAGAVDPSSLQRSWCITHPLPDAPRLLEEALAAGTVPAALARLTPGHAEYVQLRSAMHLYRAMRDWTEVTPGPTLRTGMRDRRVAELRARLDVLPRSDLFDEHLAEVVRDFQRHHGLDDDGAVGPKTIAELNVSRQARLRQIVLNLERWRWMPPILPDRHVLVNVAAFEASLVERGRTTLATRIVAGKEFTPTPFFSAAIERVIVNPPWNVPDSIAGNELWPKQHRDNGYFAREHIRIVDGKLRQEPGPWCALGRVKFDMPNRFSVYLHDTPARSLFAADLRAFSHGCIRVERPLELAAALTGRSVPDIEQIVATGRETPLRLDEPVPVFVLYWTAFVADDGHVEFRRDVYGLDPPLDARLAEGARR